MGTLLSSLIPLQTPTPACSTENSTELINVRRKFREIAGSFRSASAPALYNGDSHQLKPSFDRNGLFSPQPVKAQSVQFTVPFLPNAINDRSEGASPTVRSKSLVASPSHKDKEIVAGMERKRKKYTNESGSPHHNLPWTEEERRRLMELMEIYPEEQVNTRRYAKIAAAIGTRTPGQVANRINKLMHKQKKKQLQTTPDDIEEVIDEQLKISAEYREYQRLKRQIELVETDPNIVVHHGFKCDACGMEPILGDRWRCTKCHEPNAIDLCHECHETGEFVTAIHRPDHRFLRNAS